MRCIHCCLLPCIHACSQSSCAHGCDVGINEHQEHEEQVVALEAAVEALQRLPQVHSFSCLCPGQRCEPFVLLAAPTRSCHELLLIAAVLSMVGPTYKYTWQYHKGRLEVEGLQPRHMYSWHIGVCGADLRAQNRTATSRLTGQHAQPCMCSRMKHREKG